MNFNTRTINLTGPQQRATVATLAKNVPDGIQVVFREPVKSRKLSQNALMWVGPLADIASQAWVNGRQFSDVTWHEFLKREFLPEDDHPEIEKLAKPGYRKWDYTPSGEKVLIGSTTELTVRGMSEYMEQVYAAGAELGVQFRTIDPREK